MTYDSGYGMPDGWVEAAAFLYVTDSIVRMADAERQQYWANVQANENSLLISLFNHHRQTHPEHAAVWYAEKDFSVGYRDRMIHYISNAPGEKWRHRVPLYFSVVAIVCAFFWLTGIGGAPNDGSNAPAVQPHLALWWALAGIASFKLSRWVKNVYMPRHTDQIIADLAANEQFQRDAAAFQIARDGYYVEG